MKNEKLPKICKRFFLVGQLISIIEKMNGKVTKKIEIQPNYEINTLVNGLWQLSGGHGKIEPQKALVAMDKYHDNGLLTWDLADHYGFAEDLVGMYNSSSQERDLKPRYFTKWVPDPGRMNRRIVEKAIDRSLQRMKTTTLDMLQLHWWNYSDEKGKKEKLDTFP